MGPLKTNNYTDLIFHVAPRKFIQFGLVPSSPADFVTTRVTRMSLWRMKVDYTVHPSSYLEGHFYK